MKNNGNMNQKSTAIFLRKSKKIIFLKILQESNLHTGSLSQNVEQNEYKKCNDYSVQ